MELGQHHLQFISSIVLILCAACVALICDFLKRNNEQLRELTVELTARREEQGRSHVPAERAPHSEMTAAPGAAKQYSVVSKERKRAVNSEALAVMERGAALAGSGNRPRSGESKPEAMPERMPETTVVSQQEAAPIGTKPIGTKTDWGSLLSRNAQAASATLEVGGQSLPAGFQDGFVLSKLVQSHQPVSGLVVSIGVNASDKSDPNMPESVSKLVQSLIGPNDFAARSSEEEFLLIYPQEHGASAQRRLSQIARQLWDFQLRSLGSFQILFSWGGVEVSSESIEEAIASASDRMQETKRGRKLLTMESPAPAPDSHLRKAV
jgi:hypothetical protein